MEVTREPHNNPSPVSSLRLQHQASTLSFHRMGQPERVAGGQSDAQADSNGAIQVGGSTRQSSSHNHRKRKRVACIGEKTLQEEMLPDFVCRARSSEEKRKLQTEQTARESRSNTNRWSSRMSRRSE
ncbi:unnamed protein product [Sphagnum balticum]